LAVDEGGQRVGGDAYLAGQGARCPAAASLASLAVSRARRSNAEPLFAIPACVDAVNIPFAVADVVADAGSWSCAGMGTDLRQESGEEER